MAPQPVAAPEASNLERTHILKQILDHVDDYSEDFNLVDFSALKNDVLKPIIDEVFDPEVQIRGFLRAFQHTDAYRASFEQIPSPEMKNQIQSFVGGDHAKDVVSGKGFHLVSHKSPPVVHHFSLLNALKELILEPLELKTAIKDALHPKHVHVKDLPVVFETAEKKVVECFSNVPFENWGESVKNTPRYTFLPNTVVGVQNVVRFANSKSYRVRCAGYRHSWSSIFSEDYQVLISLVNLETVTTIPDPMSIIDGEYNAATTPELKTIELKEETGPGKRLCRIGVSVTNEEFRRWSVANKAWAIPVDVILVEVTIGGVNGPICHGAGISHKTVSDYVRRIEYVDCHGELRVVDDPYLIKAAAGAFGLLGVVTHITIELGAMTYAVLQPVKVDIGLAIPPTSPDQIPEALREKWFSSANAQEIIAAAKNDFVKRATEDYYSEWFWFSYQRKAWINTFNTTTDATGAITYPDDANTFLQWIQGWLGGVITSVPFFNAIPGYWQAQLMASLGMAALPPTLGESRTPTYKTLLPNALHFRRGIQNMRVRDMEFQIPLPPRADDASKPDFSVVQRAWWDVINLVYAAADNKEDPSSPMRLTLELRIMGGSDMIMAPQRGNNLGTASIEILTLPDAVTDDEWATFSQQVCDLWLSYDNKLNVRPHWAKEWEGVRFRGMEATQYMKEVAYPSQIKEFKDALAKIGEGQGWTLGDLQKRFSNQLWDKVIF